MTKYVQVQLTWLSKTLKPLPFRRVLSTRILRTEREKDERDAS